MQEGHHKRHKEVIARLSRIEGHVRGLRKMVEEDKECPDVLLQVAAVRAALNQVGRILLEDHMESCVMRQPKKVKAKSHRGPQSSPNEIHDHRGH